jgi:hypothetical protein
MVKPPSPESNITSRPGNVDCAPIVWSHSALIFVSVTDEEGSHALNVCGLAV